MSRHRPTARLGPARRWTSLALVVACGLVLAGAALRIAVHDPTDEPVSGDQASFVYQALSLRGGDLAYDASDQERWLALGWADQPHGLFLQQRGDGWAFAKPLGYSIVLAPALAVFGAHGISLVGAALVLAYAGCWYAIGRRRWDRSGAAVVATAATVASHAWWFGFPAHADLFVAVIVGVAALAALHVAWPPVATRDRLEVYPKPGGPGTLKPSDAGRFGGRRRWDRPEVWLTVAAMASGLLVTEKLPALVALGPLLVLALWRAPWRARALAGLAGAVVVAVSVVPYLYYSDGASWSAYGGDRFYAAATTPWSGGTEADLTPWRTRDSLSPSYVLDSVRHPSDDLPAATATYVIGRHTGVATFQPVVAALAVAAAVGLWARRARWHRRWRPGPSTSAAMAAGAGLVAYAALYLVAFTDNYFGGGQSIGDRYFLQVSVLVAVVAVGAGVTSRAARWCGAAAAVWALVALTPQLRHPEEAFYRIDRTSAVQRWLPFEATQVHAWRFQCEPALCVPPPLAAYGEG